MKPRKRCSSMKSCLLLTTFLTLSRGYNSETTLTADQVSSSPQMTLRPNDESIRNVNEDVDGQDGDPQSNDDLKRVLTMVKNLANDSVHEDSVDAKMRTSSSSLLSNTIISVFNPGNISSANTTLFKERGVGDPLVFDEDDEEILYDNYSSGELPRPRFVMLGQQGVGKSSLANTLIGFDNLASLTDKKIRKQLPFKIGHGLRSKTKTTTFCTGRWLGMGPNITVVDTPGFKDTEDAEFVDELMTILGDEVKEVDSFLIVFKYKDRFTKPFKRTLTMLTKMFGNFWTNVVLVVNFWSFKAVHVEERISRGVTPADYSDQLKRIFQTKFELDFSLPLVFIDSHFNQSNIEEQFAFKRETDKLWSATLNKRPFECLTRKDMQRKLKKEKQDFAVFKWNCRATRKANKDLQIHVKTQEKQIVAQHFVMTNLRNGIEYLKEHCNSNQSWDMVYGCQWSEWTSWSECSQTCGPGTLKRIREKLPGPGTCDGDAKEIASCTNEVCPYENDEHSLIMVVGGETINSRDNYHSKSVEILGPGGVCNNSEVPDLPDARGKLCVVYDTSGVVIVCGGGERFWMPNGNCWQLAGGATHNWQEISQMFPVHGAATAFFKGKMWVFGGSTGDDSHDHTITDKVQAYNPKLQKWSVETPLTNPRHKACAVAIDNVVVITGGTMLGLGKIKPLWLAEIGTRTAEVFDGTTWAPLPAMNRAKVEHGCTVATVGGARGIIVAGGATGDDLVEFLDWSTKSKWKSLSKLNRGRGMMPGLGFIGGKLSIIGGYSWPGAVELIEEWDDSEEEWIKSSTTLKYKRYNHGTVTVPGDMFPQCIHSGGES